MSNGKKIVHRSSITGQFVTESYADKHKSTTERERVSIGARKKSSKK